MRTSFHIICDLAPCRPRSIRFDTSVEEGVYSFCLLMELPERIDTVRANNELKCGGSCLVNNSLGFLDPSSENNGIS
jgi:hypothetical protein